MVMGPPLSVLKGKKINPNYKQVVKENIYW